MMIKEWLHISDTLYELTPEGSKFLLEVRRKASGKWQAFVGGHDVDEGKEFVNLATAQEAAWASYTDYWSDFEDPTEGW